MPKYLCNLTRKIMRLCRTPNVLRFRLRTPCYFSRQITMINSKFCYFSLDATFKQAHTFLFFYLKNQFVISPFSFTENGFHWREPSPQICQKASIEARGRWQSSDLRVWAEWPSAARGHLVSPRSSSSHVFTIPESTNLRIFSRNFLWFILYKVR